LKKHIVIAKLFDSGGSNEHLKTLIKYLGKDNVILILEDSQQLTYFNKIDTGNLYKVKVKQNLLSYAHLNYRFTTNVKELFFVLKSLLYILLLSLRFGAAPVTVSVVEPEKFLYLLWLPFIKVNYILHTQPHSAMSTFTPFTCNSVLSKTKKIITVSQSMQEIIVRNWAIKPAKSRYVIVIHNSIAEDKYDATDPPTGFGKKQLVTTAGHVADRKNPHIWLRVAKIITATRGDVEFLWLGNGPLLEKFTENTINEPSITFYGVTDNCQSFLRKTSIYYQPSTVEPHGIAVLEAMYNGIPCVVSNVGGLTESVKKDYNGLWVDPNDADEHVRAISKLLDNKKERELYGQNSLKRYNDLFTYDAFKRKMDEAYA